MDCRRSSANPTLQSLSTIRSLSPCCRCVDTDPESCSWLLTSEPQEKLPWSRRRARNFSFPPRTRTFLAVALVALLAAGVFVVIKVGDTINRVNVVAYFDSSNGIFEGDDVVILGVPVGRIDKIEPEPERVKISFWYDARHKVPADVNAAILSPMLVTSRSAARSTLA